MTPRCAACGGLLLYDAVDQETRCLLCGRAAEPIVSLPRIQAAHVHRVCIAEGCWREVKRTGTRCPFCAATERAQRRLTGSPTRLCARCWARPASSTSHRLCSACRVPKGRMPCQAPGCERLCWTSSVSGLCRACLVQAAAERRAAEADTRLGQLRAYNVAAQQRCREKKRLAALAGQA